MLSSEKRLPFLTFLPSICFQHYKAQLYQIWYEKSHSIWNFKVSSLLNFVPYVLTCQRALRVFVSTYQRALRAHVLTCQHVLRAHVPTFLACSRANVSCVSTCSRTSLPCALCVPTCSRAITTNNKAKFSITCFPYTFWLFFVFFLWNETVALSCIFLTNQKPLTGAMTNFVQWNGLIFVWA